ncbi:MAG: bifunctional adenosylcobinamide kinase/adenosylcobinamide-phosphate guanylyltransferase [Clostridia bacterium]|nr:bifunctional adenosylcobinamide kinase/adenosylcobinamide-phosphate guanylyltransferase [Clostridia bacterium]
MTVLISGGSKNGKTGLAQDIAVKLSGDGKRYYVATMIPYDDEDRARIGRHIAERAGLGFDTLEIGTDIARCLDGWRNGTFLLDSVTALLANEMFSSSQNGNADPGAFVRCRDGLLKLARCADNAVFVTDYIYSDAIRYDALTEQYRETLALLDRALAEVCDTVIEMCAGNLIFHKGGIAL